MFEIKKKKIIELLSKIINGSKHTKCLLLSNQKCMTQPTFINLHPNELQSKMSLLSICGNIR